MISSRTARINRDTAKLAKSIQSIQGGGTLETIKYNIYI